MAFLYTGIHSLKGTLALAGILSIALWARGQEDEAQPFSIDQITGTEEQAGLPLSDEELRKILDLYPGSWRGSIDLTDKFGTVLQTLPVESEYRLDTSGGKVVLLGRFQFGQDKKAKYSSSEVEISNGFLINRINQEGKNTVYRGEIEDGKIAWREYGVPRSEYNVFYESFDERNGRRICTTQSRNLRRDRDGTEKTYFTAGRYIYTGALEKWTLPEPSFKDTAVETTGATPDQAATGEGSTPGGNSISTVGEMSRRRAEGIAAAELPADLKVAQAEVASLRDQLEAEQTASAKLRARIAELEKQVAQLKGEPLPETDATSAPADEATGEAGTSTTGTPASEPEDEPSSGRSTFRSRVR